MLGTITIFAVITIEILFVFLIETLWGNPKPYRKTNARTTLIKLMAYSVSCYNLVIISEEKNGDSSSGTYLIKYFSCNRLTLKY